MKSLVLSLVFIAIAAAAEPPKNIRGVDIKSADGTILKGTYFAAAKPGPGVLLFHQSNRTRDSWSDIAAQLAAAGINTLTVDSRGHGETGGSEGGRKIRQLDQDAALQFLTSQPGVNRDIIGLGGAGVLGVENATETAHRHSAQAKSLVLLSGETGRPEIEFLHQTAQLPGLYVSSDEDEYPPTQEAMQLLYTSSSSPSKKLVYYPAVKKAPWLWYEPFDIGKVPATGGHGTDLFKPHPELPAIIVDWFVTTLVKTPGHAPADSIACAATINALQIAGGATQVEQQLIEARKKDPQAQLFPEITASIIGQDFMREGDVKSAIVVFKLIATAYPDSADNHDNLAGAYLKDEQKDLARQHAEKALSILDAHRVPASSWTDTDQYRGEIRRDLEKILKELGSGSGH